jgi:hypothetical protein
MKKYIVMGVVVAVLSVGMAFALNTQKVSNAKAQSNLRNNTVTKQADANLPKGCGCTQNEDKKCGCKDGGQRKNFVDANGDGQCDNYKK